MGSKGSSQRPISAEERALLDSQKVNLDLMTQIAAEQYGISTEERDYYINTFRQGTDTQAKEAIAQLQSRITGQPVSAASIQAANVDSLLRDTILAATPEFQTAAANLVASNQQLTATFGQEFSGLSTDFAKGLQDLTTNYSQELQAIKDQTGTINQDILSRETGAAKAGISTSYAEARKQMEASMAQRGLSGSGIEANMLANTYQQEVMAKTQAGYQARQTALQQSEAIRQQQAALAGQQLQAGTAGLAQAYQAQAGAIQNIYGATTQAELQNYQQTQAATLQGIAGLTQLGQMGQGVYQGAASYIAGAAGTAGSAAQTAGSTAGQLASAQSAYTQAQATESAGIGQFAGLVAQKINTSDMRLKTNIEFSHVENGYNIYTWDWVEGHNYGYNKGVLAQEVLEINPDAVVMMDNGYYAVDYSKLGV